MSDPTNLPALPQETTLDEMIAAAGVDKHTAAALKEDFIDFIPQIETWAANAKSLVVTSSEQTELMAQAREARLGLVKVRKLVEKKKDELKADALAYNRIIQSVHNYLRDSIKPIEDHLKDQEEFAKREEDARRIAIYNSRMEKLKEYPDSYPVKLDYHNMDDDAFEAILTGARNTFIKNTREREEAEAAAKAAEEAAAAAERAQAAENARIRRELEAREEAERLAREEAKRLEAEVKEAPDHVKFGLVANQVRAIEIPTMATAEAQANMDSARSMINQLAAVLDAYAAKAASGVD